MIITHGPTIADIGQVSGGGTAMAPRGLTKIGYQYDNFGIFWLDLWTWGGDYVIYDGVKDGGHGKIITKAQAAAFMGVDEGKLSKPLNYSFPYGLDIIVALGLLRFVPRMIAKKKHANKIPEFKQGAVPAWTPPPASSGQPVPPPSAGGPPPMPPPLPPEDR
jgi:hypothetical protein